MKIDLFYIGKQSKNLYSEAEAEFYKRIKRYCKFNISAIAPLKNTKSLSPEEVRHSESQLFNSKRESSARLILLDETGKKFNSREFALFLEKQLSISPKLNFIIGGAYGFNAQFRSEADAVISLSDLTFPHHLARLVFLEQLYRGFSILNNEPYHND